MLFNSIDFAIFLPLVFLIYWLVGKKNIKLQNSILLLASYFFYGWWDWRFLSLILFSSTVDFIIGKNLYRIHNPQRRRLLLHCSIFINIGLLGFFKYFNFFLESFNNVFSFLGHEISIQRLNIVLPVGISFYTFQTLSYTIDIYKNKIKPTNNLVAFFTFVSFFPQLVAGPIERASNLLPQFTSSRIFSSKNFSYGFKLLLWGFFLKTVVADRAAIYVNAVYGNIDSHEGLSFLVATLLFAFQIYGDFAGYSLIAIGTAKLLGFDLMTNFKRPYFARSVGEFWQRWHISLSTWFRDYVYIALGGNRVSKMRLLFNIFITFLISGLWHGANWTFVIWGALNGGYLICEVLLSKRNKGNILNICITFLLINISWVFFRADTIQDAFFILKTIVTNPGQLYIGSGDDITALVYAFIAIVMLLIIELKQEFLNSYFSISKIPSSWVRMGIYAVLVFIILYLGVFDEGQFIYFQF